MHKGPYSNLFLKGFLWWRWGYSIRITGSLGGIHGWPVDSPDKSTVMRNFGVSFVLNTNKLFDRQSYFRWFDAGFRIQECLFNMITFQICSHLLYIVYLDLGSYQAFSSWWGWSTLNLKAVLWFTTDSVVNILPRVKTNRNNLDNTSLASSWDFHEGFVAATVEATRLYIKYMRGPPFPDGFKKTNKQTNKQTRKEGLHMLQLPIMSSYDDKCSNLGWSKCQNIDGWSIF